MWGGGEIAPLLGKRAAIREQRRQLRLSRLYKFIHRFGADPDPWLPDGAGIHPFDPVQLIGNPGILATWPGPESAGPDECGTRAE